MVVLDAKTRLTLQDFIKIVIGFEKVQLSPELLEKCHSNFKFLEDFAADKVIYGINTGFGPMAQHKIPFNDRLNLQYNLIRSHASGSGKVIDNVYIRATLVDRLNTLAQARSGVHTDLLLLICDLINSNLLPVIYEHGGVGASGDLVQLAHVALAIIGEGELIYEGKIHPAADVFKQLAITPFAVKLREGIALMNGTSCMTGIGLVNIYRAQKLVKWCMLLSATINEIFEAFDDHIHDKLNSTKLHNGQNKIAFAMRAVLQGSRLLKNRKEYMYYDTDETHFKYKVQEYYSLRCVPQILGPVYDTVQYAENVLVNELNSVSDNPVVDEESENVFHGGNFHGDYISLEMDKVRIAITKLSMLAERQLNYLLNDKLNGSLPPFINRSVIGLNFGLQGVQYTATSTVAENQSLSGSVYIHSIPNNKDNQDVVSMGSNAALLTARVIENSFEVLAIEAIAVAEAIESLGNSDKLNQSSLKFYNDLRRILPPSADDQPVFRHIKSVKQYLENNDLTEIDTQL